ncbi:MAG: SIMPL domain-containing protein [Dehalococcoidia bacterium]|nr:SIMPL domain-containing protein [Dehalococcoidia bacterium]
MTRKIRMAMIGAVLALLLPVLALAGCTAVAPATAPNITVGSQQEGIWVTGQGEVQAVPDIAVLSLGVQAQAPTVAEAQNQAKQAMDSVMAALKANGVEEKDIQTTGYSIWQQTRWDNDKQEEIVTGYQVSNSVRVKVRKVADAGTILDAAVTAGGDLIRVQGIHFEVDDPTAFLADARSKAVADAKMRAQQLASLAGVDLGKPTYITESYYNPIIYRDVEMAKADSQAPAPTPITPGETTITASVQIVYAIE